MIEAVAKLVYPCAIVLGIALWAKSAGAVGDGFSAGAVASVGAVVQFVCLDHDHAARVTGARWAWVYVAAGLGVVLTVSLAPVFYGLPPVWHVPRPGAHVGSFSLLKFHTAMLFDMGVAVLVYGAVVGSFDRIFPPLRGDSP